MSLAGRPHWVATPTKHYFLQMVAALPAGWPAQKYRRQTRIVLHPQGSSCTVLRALLDGSLAVAHTRMYMLFHDIAKSP